MIHGHSSYTYQPVPGIIETKSSTFLNVALRTSQSRQIIIIIKSRTSLFDFHCCWKLRRYSLINSAGIQYFVNWFILFINRYCYFLFIFCTISIYLSHLLIFISRSITRSRNVRSKRSGYHIDRFKRVLQLAVFGGDILRSFKCLTSFTKERPVEMK